MVDETILATASSCSVVAPAGCGKTELIALAIAATSDRKKFLVLTHTHAGVRAIRQRFKKLKIPLSRARIDTIAGWSLDYASSYTATTGIKSATPSNDEDWDAVYSGVEKLLQVFAIQQVVRASYAAVYIDEYQDCTREQHGIAIRLSKILPCRVLGDPLQGIFQFAGATLSWHSEVEPNFPSIGKLETGWRWKETNPDLGNWLLLAREQLRQGLPIDLTDARIVWRQVNGENQGAIAKKLRGAEGHVIAIRKFPAAAHGFARKHKGYSSMEEILCQDLLQFADKMDTLSGSERALSIIDFASMCATKVGAYCAAEVKKLRAGKEIRSSRIKDAQKKSTVDALIDVCASDDLSLVDIALGQLLKTPGIRAIRHELIRATKNALVAKQHGIYSTFREAAWASRNKSRHFDKHLRSHLVSRTLLVKGLEFEHAFIVDAGDFSGPDAAQNFYVAITRGSTSLTILSKSSIVQFDAPSL